MGNNRRRQQQRRRMSWPAGQPVAVRVPDVSAPAVDELDDDMSWLAPQALPWLQADEKRSA